ncbi:MAG: tRNA-dihydrouridine synthase, partial [Pseudomonadales bacterium]|nr:tRNA-dihydrouridine synthase [Pseudomonadales bacterium]
LDGVMIGREAYQNPSMLHEVDSAIYDASSAEFASTLAVAHRFAEYMDTQLTEGVRLNHMTRHLLGLFNGQAGARLYRRHLSENANKTGAGVDVFMAALDKLN